MPAALSQATVVLVGNPNTGKTTLFNALTGLNQRVANYPGVTVEWKSGSWVAGDREVSLVDLPGSYSLKPRSADEAVVLDTLSGRVQGLPKPDLILVILDASNLDRNLYLCSQVCELGLPMVLALNMGDVAESRGLKLDPERLEKNLGLPVVAIQANRRLGLDILARRVGQTLHGLAALPAPPRPHENDLTLGSSEDVKAHYGWIRRMLEGALTRPMQPVSTFSDRVDKVLVHRFWGSLILVGVMALLFQSVFTWARPVMDAINGLMSMLGRAAGGMLAEGPVKSLLVNGAVAGAGAVLTFVPQIAALFLFIAVLEDCGYMARSAFLMDKLLSKAGLSGKSFIPMLSSFACAVPGIMSTRTIESWKDRLATMVVAPLMSCSARLPVYFILIAAFVPDRPVVGFLRMQGLVLLGLYALGLAVAVPVAWLLKKFWLKGETPAFIMELPSYKWPDPRTVFQRVLHQVRAFVWNAGTLIFSVAILVWALSYFPRSTGIQNRYQRLRADPALQVLTPEERRATLDGLDADQAGEELRQSLMGRMGRALEPAFRPLGWDWRISMAALASFPAREVVVATLGTIFNLGSQTSGQPTQALGDVLKKARWPDGRPLFTLATALSIMVFFALCCQCASTLSVMRQESGGWGWPAFTFTYMTALAYVAALAVYQIGSRI
jgi:ferrous iron transport protein B